MMLKIYESKCLFLAVATGLILFGGCRLSWKQTKLM